jgi:hypothetical protein
MVPPPEVSRAMVPGEAAYPLVLAVQWADVQCSSWLCSAYGPSKALKNSFVNYMSLEASNLL